MAKSGAQEWVDIVNRIRETATPHNQNSIEEKSLKGVVHENKHNCGMLRFKIKVRAKKATCTELAKSNPNKKQQANNESTT